MRFQSNLASVAARKTSPSRFRASTSPAGILTSALAALQPSRGIVSVKSVAKKWTGRWTYAWSLWIISSQPIRLTTAIPLARPSASENPPDVTRPMMLALLGWTKICMFPMRQRFFV